MIRKTIVVFANSVKHGQHCVAGKCINTNTWVRPVGNASGAELTHAQAKCRNPHGDYNVKPMQKIEIILHRHVPLPHQPENYTISSKRWIQRYKIADRDLCKFIDDPSDLWGEGDSVDFESIRNGVITIRQSLYLVRVEDLHLYRNSINKRRAHFSYKGINYDLAVTDPNFDDITENSRAVKGILCISLAENFKGRCYKLVAAIY